jgi:hypothetical protein
MKLLTFLLLVPSLGHAIITPWNLGFEDPTVPFPSGWITSGTVSPTAGLLNSTAAQLAAGASIHQDFAPTTGDGLAHFTTSFTWMLAGSGNIATDTCRVRLRGNNNDSSKNLITLRLSPAGLQTFSSPGWNTDVAFTPRLGVTYTVTLVAGNLDGDASNLIDYQVAIDDGTGIKTGPIRVGWHSGANTTATNTTVGTPFETLRFEAGAGNTLVVDDIALPGFPSKPGNQLVANPDFETPPFPSSWTNSGGLEWAGFNGSATAARLPYNSTATLSQQLGASSPNFTADVSLQIAGNTAGQAFRWQLDAGGTTAIDLRTTIGGVLEVNLDGIWNPLLRLSDGTPFAIASNQTVKLRVIGRDFGAPTAAYNIVWSDPGSATFSHAATQLRVFASSAAPSAGIDNIRFSHDLASGNSFSVDDVTVSDLAVPPPAPDHSPTPPPPPASDKIVSISGVYPHLAMTNTHDECGVGAVVPWAGKLWAITYAPHQPNGSTDKLYEISPDLSRVTRPESVGGTPANRIIHAATEQLNIGPYFIDRNRNIRVIPPASAPGRLTASALHLTDPDRLYIFTMEDGVYDINAKDLTLIKRYPDVQGKGDRFLFGYHGKGAYTGQGRLIVTNNGRPNHQNDPTGPAGVLATWDGNTVADNGGSYSATNDPNNTAEENTVNPVAAQPQYIAGWTQVSKTQHCEATGPGGIHGNPNPGIDPVWATGFDAKSVLLHVMENRQWSLWRLPKGSYSHDGSHGWHTEWPRIRQLDPGDRQSIYLMHMHGIFYNFPGTFSAANFANLAPISNYYKMPTDYATFNGRIVMGKNDTSRFSNALVPKAESNLWFGTLEDLRNWGSPAGHGAVWMNEAVTTGRTSDPFLIGGFANRTLHLRNLGANPLEVEIETSTGTPVWTPLRSVHVAAGSYTFTLLDDVAAPWVRLRTSAASSNFTAFFHLNTPYPHGTPASVRSDEFAALADIRDTRSMSDGVIRVMNNTALQLEFASSRTSSSGAASAHRYHRIGGPMTLDDGTDATSESTLRGAAATSRQFGSDAASAWITEGADKFRLPKTDPLYEAAFAAGWARGFREVVTERQILNCHGTFYEVPRANSGGHRRMRALTTHGKRITDFASWRGLWVLTGVLDDAPASSKLVKNADGTAALWLGEIDDLWRMGEPRGKGGPWKDTVVAANTPSDPYLMYGYDHKELTMTTSEAITLTVEVDFLADNTWSVYRSFSLAAGETLTHVFPAGFHAHWVRVQSSAPTTASAQFTYGPADRRDCFLDWARDHQLPTGGGRTALAGADSDSDLLSGLAEFVLGSDPGVPNPWPLAVDRSGLKVVLRDLSPADGIDITFESSTDLGTWTARPDLVVPDPDQSGVSPGFTRMRFAFPAGARQAFARVRMTTRVQPTL